FYVGENVTEKDIHPKYENGILSFKMPKDDKKAVEEKKHYIAIEG
ncbi:MAG: Hsp20/alpha crystallin family protein, partial [Lachnospiraceae bacterium]|nr:Hsp20/alpha crystallin family protein [Lachnospiraceae bacterium]